MNTALAVGLKERILTFEAIHNFLIAIMIYITEFFG
jgi:hypothetical protein